MTQLNGTNGTVNRVENVKGKASKASKPTTVKASKGRGKKTSLKVRQKLSIIVGAVGVSVLALSLWHCTEALAQLTGSPIVLAALLAIGIDAGMVVSEIASILSTGEAQLWANRYVGTAVALSVALNSFASAQNAERFVWLAAIVGAIVPVLVYMLARVSGHLWRD